LQVLVEYESKCPNNTAQERAVLLMTIKVLKTESNPVSNSSSCSVENSVQSFRRFLDNWPTNQLADIIQNQSPTAPWSSLCVYYWKRIANYEMSETWY